MTLRIIPAADRYPGLTGLHRSDGIEVVCADTGPEAERAVRERVSDWEAALLACVELADVPAVEVGNG